MLAIPAATVVCRQRGMRPFMKGSRGRSWLSSHWLEHWVLSMKTASSRLQWSCSGGTLSSDRVQPMAPSFWISFTHSVPSFGGTQNPHSAFAMASRNSIGSTDSSDVHSWSNAANRAAFTRPTTPCRVSPQSPISAWKVTAHNAGQSRGGAPRGQTELGSSVPQQTSLTSSRRSASVRQQ